MSAGAAGAPSAGPSTTDRLGRPLRDLRISVTDRCNFRCTYCMPREVYGQSFRFLPHDRAADLRGDHPPGARSPSAWACARSASPAASRCCAATSRSSWPCSPALPGLADLTLTTNGSLLAAKAAALAEAGLHRVTVSLDSLDDDVFARLNDVDFPVARVLEGIAAAERAGLAPIKVNMVVRRGRQRGQHPADGALRARARLHPALHRVHGRRPHQRLEPRRGRARRARSWPRIDAEMPLEALPAHYPGEVADPLALPRRRRRDRRHRLGHAALLRRLHARPADRRGHALHLPLRRPRHGPAGAPAREATTTRTCASCSARVWQARRDRYSELRSEATVALPKVEMSRIGG